VNFTDKGLHEIKDTVKRSEAFRALAMKHGATVKEIYWTDGGYDMVTIIDAPNDLVAAALTLNEATQGYRRVETLRGFTADQMEKILEESAGDALRSGFGVFLRA
jgi:uncharacterized protein with GYD domain